MATTTKSNRKKPAKTASAARASKTTKKTAVKTPVKTASARSKAQTKSKTVAKKDSAKAAVSRSTRTRTPLEMLRSLHLSKTFLYTVFAGLVIAFAETAEKPVTLALQTRDQFADSENVVLTPVYEVLYNVEPKYVLAASLLLGALGSLVIATRLRNRYEATIANRTSGFRWVVLGLSSAVLLSFLNLLGGVHDLAALKLSAVLIIVTTMFAWLAERDNRGAGRPKWLAYVISLFTGVLAWLPLAGSLFGTSVYGMERFGWHVYALAGVVLLGFIAFALNQYSDLKARGTRREYSSVEQTYLRTDMLTKFAVVLIVLLALQ